MDKNERRELRAKLVLARDTIQDAIDQLDNEPPGIDHNLTFACKDPESDWIVEQKRRWDTVTHRQEFTFDDD